MEYQRTITLKDGKLCCLRNGVESDGQAVLELYQRTHSETDYLRSYPDENHSTAVQEGLCLKKKALSENELEVLAVVEGVIAGSAGIKAVGAKHKVRHRAELGISVISAFWGAWNRTGLDGRMH